MIIYKVVRTDRDNEGRWLYQLGYYASAAGAVKRTMGHSLLKNSAPLWDWYIVDGRRPLATINVGVNMFIISAVEVKE